MSNKAARGVRGNLAVRLGKKHVRSDVSQYSADAGFTLIEMLVVLVLTAVMAGMMVGGIRQMQTWAQLEKRQSAQSGLEALADHMAGELAGALSLPLLDPDEDTFMPMAGTSDEIRFVAVIRTGFSAKALRQTSYSTEQSPIGATVVRKSRPHQLPQQGVLPSVQSEELYNGVSTLKFAYLSRTVDHGVRWLASWTTEATLPLAVRIQISLVADGVVLRSSRTVSLIN